LRVQVTTHDETRGNEAEVRSKEPLPGYMLFVEEVRPHLAKEKPDLSFRMCPRPTCTWPIVPW
jgi:hypothetical protein